MKITNLSGNNKIIEGENVSYENAEINFNEGNNNIIFLDDGVNLGNSQLRFRGDSSMIFLRYFRSRPVLVRIFMPSLGIVEQEAIRCPRSSSTMHIRQAPYMDRESAVGT